MHLTFHRTIFWAHLVTGLLAGLVILSMAVSGLMISYEVQLQDWANRGLRVTPPEAGAKRLGIEALVAKVRETKPGVSPTGITWKADPAAPVMMSVGREGAFYVNPYTGADLGEGSKAWHDFFHAATDWHRFLTQTGLERPVGKAITGAGCLVFGVLLLSGIYLWWPRHWRWANVRAVILFNPALRDRARNWNWHNVIGFWSSFPMLLIILTGLIMSYGWANNLLFRLTGNEPPPPRTAPPGAMAAGPGAGDARRAGGGEGPGGGERRREGGGPPSGGGPESRGQRPAGPPLKLDGLDPLLTQAEQSVPGWRSATLRMPMAPGAPLTLALDLGGRGEVHRRSSFNLDLAKPALQTSPEDFQKLNLGRQLRMYARFLHTGELFGWIGQTIAALCALSAILLVWTGFMLAFRRFIPKKTAGR